jgi:uncharacterized protein YtpQ (UPF0354 family)
MTPTEFTQKIAERLRENAPTISISTVADLQLTIKTADGHESTAFLDNAYNTYKMDPANVSEVIQTFITSFTESINEKEQPADRNLIVPVIKDRPWLEDIRNGLSSRGAKKVPDLVFEDFNSDLVIVYAEDTPSKIRYLNPDQLQKLGIDRSELRKIACENLTRLLPPIQCHGTNGYYMLTAGESYEASLLLLDSIWSGNQMVVDGDYVVAIPTRDVLLVTGSKNSLGLKTLKESVEKSSAENPYRLTSKLFVYRNGKFEEFKDDLDSRSN